MVISVKHDFCVGKNVKQFCETVSALKGEHLQLPYLFEYFTSRGYTINFSLIIKGCSYSRILFTLEWYLLVLLKR